ncbi:NnrS family protein [Devosia rhodophyticola]|uniref:NnrS family protein n=1 Tax=Devosia rhodophyticola TaxID=3026423 RepID=A0ABY7YY24_9HYPH|nr:NnrS family protein [Devosia rhodophyticola]WDR05998.1 NnrS family protein [Devosia rhodophyticola]
MAATIEGQPRRQPVPRGIARTGPVLFSYGFRPFFLTAGLWAIAAMGLWIGALILDWPVGGSFGAPNWHAHEMLFGYTSAALAGFLLTAVPNWTGRLPVSGTPLIGLFSVWIAGRLAMLWPDALPPYFAVVIDAAFLPLLLAICAREIVAGRKWKDVKILAGVGALALANIGYHAVAANGGDIGMANRAAISAYIMLISIMGGRVVPSFTRNWLAKRGKTALPAPFSRFDTVVLLIALLALIGWTVAPDAVWVAALAATAGVLHGIRLARWRGWKTWGEKLVSVLHVGYSFVPLGFFGITLAQMGWLNAISALHLFTVGAIGVMTLAVMTRATRGHTGLPLAASKTTAISYGLLILAAIARPLVDVWPDLTVELLAIAGTFWILAFVLYALEYAPILLRRRRERGE